MFDVNIININLTESNQNDKTNILSSLTRSTQVHGHNPNSNPEYYNFKSILSEDVFDARSIKNVLNYRISTTRSVLFQNDY